MVDFSKHVGRVLTDLGEDVVYLGTGALSVPVRGVFDTQYVSDDGMVTGVESANIALTILDSLVTGIQQGHRFTIRGVTYSVASIKPDGAGTLVLILRKY